MNRTPILLAFLFFVCTPFAFPEEPPDPVRAALISEVESVRPGTTIWTALHLRMDPGWHTYWKNPGDSGLPTTIDWELPEGWSAGAIHWPFPERVRTANLMTYAYHHEVFLLVPIQVPLHAASGTDVSLAAHAQWLVCEVQCFPGEARLKLDLPVRGETPVPDKRWLAAFAETRAKLPMVLPDWELEAFVRKGKMMLRIQPPSWAADDLFDVYFFPEDTEVVEYSAPQTLKKIKNGYGLELKISKLAPEPLEKLNGVLVSEAGWRGLGSERALQVNASVRSEPLPSSTAGLPVPGNVGAALVFAFLGGLILNLMPCVLPVLSLKVLGFVKQAEEERSSVWKHGVVFLTGVLISFWVLAVFISISVETGRLIGWGFQLQSPAFLVLLSALFFLMALNLFGVYEIGISLAGHGAVLPSHVGLPVSFLNGVLAVVVATPCTAPFMGSALGYALTQPALVSFLVFTLLGLGMGFPYALLSFFPALLKFVPRPGPWMIALKRFLGFLLIATAVWLAWILHSQAGPQSIGALAAGLVLMGLGAWIYGRGGKKKGKVVAGLFLLAGLALPFAGVTSGDRIDRRSVDSFPGKSDGIPWRPFSPQELEDLLRSGKPVFVNFTAAWCLTCQVNDRIAFRAPRVVRRFEELGVAAIKADWTARDEEIARALRGLGRTSIPVYALYAPGSETAPVLLPELLTPGAVLEALNALEE